MLNKLEIKYYPLDKLIPYSGNARTHSENQVNEIVKSIKKHGWTNPILLDGNDGIIAGHGRLLAAKKLGLNEVPTIDLSFVSDAQKAEYIIADNKLALNADWDYDILNLQFNILEDAGIDLVDTGFSEEELNAIRNPEILNEGLCDEDEVPEITVKPITKLGDIWLLGNHRLMCGDSTMIDDVEKLMNGAKGDMVFTDPPYGYSYESNYYKDENPWGMLKNDDSIIDFMPVLFATLNENAAIYICGSHQTMHKWRDIIDQHFKYKNLIIWKKNNWSMGDLKGAYAGQHELIFFAHKGKVSLRGERHRDVWEFDRDPPKDHPTQKPIEMVEFAINNTSDIGNIIIDLFGGSGSTLIACEKTNRKCFMMELSPVYCDVIINRWQKFTGKDAILESTKQTFDEVANG